MLLGDSVFSYHAQLQKPFGSTTPSRKQLHLLLEQDQNGNGMCFWPTKSEMATFYRKSEVNQHSLKVNVSACILLYNMCIGKGDRISAKLDMSYILHDKNDNTRKSPQELRIKENYKNGV